MSLREKFQNLPGIPWEEVVEPNKKEQDFGRDQLPGNLEPHGKDRWACLFFLLTPLEDCRLRDRWRASVPSGTNALVLSPMELEPILLMEASQEWKNKHRVYSPLNWY